MCFERNEILATTPLKLFWHPIIVWDFSLVAMTTCLLEWRDDVLETLPLVHPCPSSLGGF